MASLARHLALRSRVLVRIPVLSPSRLQGPSRHALSRYYSSDRHPPPPAGAEHAQKKDGLAASQAGESSTHVTGPEESKVVGEEGVFDRSAIDLENPEHLTELDNMFQEVFPDYPQDLSLQIKLQLLEDISDGREPRRPEDFEGEDASNRGFYVDPNNYKTRFPRDLPLPDLAEPVPIYDLKETLYRRATAEAPFPSRITIRNDPSMFVAMDSWKPENPGERMLHEQEQAAYANEMEEELKAKASEEGEQGLAEEIEDDEDLMDEFDEDMEGEADDQQFTLPWTSGEETDNTTATRKVLALNDEELMDLHVYTLMRRRVVQQTPKGKLARYAALVVVGNGDGLVGYGYAKSSVDSTGSGAERAFIKAVRSMDYVDRFEDRTVWTEMQDKMGATRIIMRPRPAGFGLQCNPYVHQICKAAGIKDISAKVWGSRTPLNVIKLTFRMLQSGNAPLGMGNGIGGGGRKLDKGSGMRGKNEVQRERGRKIHSLLSR